MGFASVDWLHANKVGWRWALLDAVRKEAAKVIRDILEGLIAVALPLLRDQRQSLICMDMTGVQQSQMFATKPNQWTLRIPP